MTHHEIDLATASMIHAVRAAGITPAKLASTVQYRKIVAALLAAGWVPPVEVEL